MAHLVTGEAVLLELRLARLPSRALALTLDILLQGAALFGVLMLVGFLSTSADNALVSAVALVSSVAVLVGYPVAMETLTRGRTLGKMALGLRVVRDDGGPIRFRHALVRGLAGFFLDFYVLGFFGAVAVISSLVSSQGKRLGDVFAGTVVVRERVPVQGGPVATMPPMLAGWAQSLELSRMPSDLLLAARQFLSRARDLAPDVRQTMAARLATDIAGHVSPPAPPGTPAEAYLAAVLAENRQRELGRLAQRGAATGWPGQGYAAQPAASPYPPAAVPWPGPSPAPAPPAYPPPRPPSSSEPDRPGGGGFAAPG